MLTQTALVNLNALENTTNSHECEKGFMERNGINLNSRKIGSGCHHYALCAYVELPKNRF